MIVEDIMIKEVVKIDPDAKISEAAKIMSEVMIGCVVVLKDGELAGIVSERDIISDVVAEEKSPSDVKVKDVMSFPVITVDPKTSIEDAVELMAKNVIRRLPVKDDGELVGIITSHDISNILPLVEEKIPKEIKSLLGSIIKLMKEREKVKKQRDVDEKIKHYIG